MTEKGKKKARFNRKPLDKKCEPKGVVHIIEERCKGCTFCVEFCPRDVLEMSEKFNKKGYHPPYVKNPQYCVKCDFCEMICPEYSIFCTKANDKITRKHK